MLRVATPDRESFLEAHSQSGLDFPLGDELVGRAFFILAEKLLPTAVDYDFLLGDDTSGRLSTLVLARLVCNVREANGLDKPIRRFAHGAYAWHADMPADYVPASSSGEARALVVTESIDNGQHARNLVGLIKKVRATETIDVATLGLWCSRVPSLGAECFVGSRSNYVATKLYSGTSNWQKGVKANRGPISSRRTDIEDRGVLLKSRHDARVLGDLLTEHLVQQDLVPPYPIHTPDTEKVLI